MYVKATVINLQCIKNDVERPLLPERPPALKDHNILAEEWSFKTG